MSVLWALSNILCLGPLGMALVNLVSWSRGGRTCQSALRVSVLVPARNEEVNIESCIDAVMASDYPVHQVVVVDDQSTDRTPDILQHLSKRYPRLEIISGEPLPPGWIGKPHACHQLSKAATGDVLLFVDADTFLEAGGISRLISLLEPSRGRQAQLVTAFPKQIMISGVERCMIPLLALTYTSWFPLFLVAFSRNRRFLAANGQLLMIRRPLYDAIGGYQAVAREIVDDMALCRSAKRLRARVVFADGFEIASCRMYRSAPELWAGFGKNLYEGIGENPIALLVVLALYGSVFAWPYGALLLTALGAIDASIVWPLYGVAANVLLRSGLAVRYSHSWGSVIAHPVAVLAFMALSVHSFRLNLANAIPWRGRLYRARRNRVAP
jgi:chlorobactene glucosyltransferase